MSLRRPARRQILVDRSAWRPGKLRPSPCTEGGSHVHDGVPASFCRRSRGSSWLPWHRPALPAAAQAPAARVVRRRPRILLDEYEAAAKISYNENPYGPSESVVKAMTDAFRFDNRYCYPDGEIPPGHSRRITASSPGTCSWVPGRARSSRSSDARSCRGEEGGRRGADVRRRLRGRLRRSGGVDCAAARSGLPAGHPRALSTPSAANYRDVGFVYLCTPNNPTGIVVTKQEQTRQLLDGIPEDVPVLIDEAYHHYVEHPDYATSMPDVRRGTSGHRDADVLEGVWAGRHAGLGTASLPRFASLIACGRTARGSINALVKWAGAAALKDTAAAERVRLPATLQLRKKTTSELEHLGYTVLPSDANFFMVHIRKDVTPVIEAFLLTRRAGRPPVPADAGTPALLGRNGRRDGSIHRRLQADRLVIVCVDRGRAPRRLHLVREPDRRRADNARLVDRLPKLDAPRERPGLCQ